MNLLSKLSREMMVAMIVAFLSTLLLCRTASASSPLTISITLETPQSVSLGEPIIGYYTIKNTSNHDLFCWTGTQKNTLLTVSTKVSGNLLANDDCPSVYLPLTGGAIRVPAASHGGVYQGYFVVNKWHGAGKHLLPITMNFPYTVAVDGVFQRYPTQHDNPPGFNQTLTSSVMILPLNVRKLRDTSEVLRRTLLKETDFDRRGILITALFSMPEALVHDCWKELVYDSRTTGLEQTYIAQSLADVPSQASAEILAYQGWAQPPVCMYPEAPRDALANMYNNADPALHQHIRELYAQHGIQVADTIDIPQVMD